MGGGQHLPYLLQHPCFLLLRLELLLHLVEGVVVVRELLEVVHGDFLRQGVIVGVLPLYLDPLLNLVCRKSSGSLSSASPP